MNDWNFDVVCAAAAEVAGPDMADGVCVVDRVEWL
jgi:hypothetical protein